MHFLGGSLREWDEVINLLGESVQTLALDLPGFGGSANQTGYTVTEMADAVQATIAAAGLGRYILVGHSMSGKVAAVIARRLEDARTSALAGVVLIASSPPGPEPMEEAKRGAMIASLGEHHADVSDRARAYISKNELRDIPKLVEDRAVAELLRMNNAAWVAWLAHGSREDWRERVGILNTPALVIAGEKDAALGPEGQRRETMPHLGNARLQVIENCSHLVPMEQPAQLAAALRRFADTVGPGQAKLPVAYRQLLDSDRVSTATRSVLEGRLAQPGSFAPVFNAQQQRTLRAALDRVLPQPAGAAIDLALPIMARLAAGANDGWRYAALPEDLAAYRNMLDRLAEDDFENLSAAQQDEHLRQFASHAGSPAARWFEDLRADAVEAWASHPQTMAALGFSGPGVGGPETQHHGFVELRANHPETWEPARSPGSAEEAH